MKRMHLICRTCGHEARIEVLTREEVERDPQQPMRRPTCPRCGSADVQLRD